MQITPGTKFRERQSWQPSRYAAQAGYVSALGAVALDLLAPQAGEHILDIGCGDGVLSEKIVAAEAGVAGIDSSADMVAVATGRGIDATVGDAQNLSFDGEFDAVFSNAALHWMPDAEKVAAGVFRALKSGGRFVGEFGGHGNVAAIRVAVRAAFEMVTGAALPPDHKYYPTAEEYSAVLEGAGFVVDHIAIVPRPTPLPAGLKGWYETFGGRFFASIGEDQRQAVMEKAIELAKPDLMDESGDWTADYIRLRFKAVKPKK